MLMLVMMHKFVQTTISRVDNAECEDIVCNLAAAFLNSFTLSSLLFSTFSSKSFNDAQDLQLYLFAFGLRQFL